jgi:hypothetical protein
MTDRTVTKRKPVSSAIFFLLVALSLFAASCKSQEQQAFQAVEQHIKATDPDLRDVKLVLFHTSASIPDKAYVSVSGTRGFASGGGTAQSDYRGFILAKDGSGWKVDQERNIKFTKNPEDADRYLAGRK